MLNDLDESLLQETFEDLDGDDEVIEEVEYKEAGYIHANCGDLSEENSKIDEIKGIATLNQLTALVGDSCRETNCSASIAKIDHHVLQCCLKFEWYCKRNHRGIWYSSPFYGAGLAVNYVVDSAILLSGGQITQFKRFCSFSNIGRCSTTSFYRNQRLYVSPAVEQEFDAMRVSIIKKLKEKSSDVVLCGDARMDSPGFSATKGAYTLMDYETKQLLTMEFGDKREVQHVFH